MGQTPSTLTHSPLSSSNTFAVASAVGTSHGVQKAHGLQPVRTAHVHGFTLSIEVLLVLVTVFSSPEHVPDGGTQRTCGHRSYPNVVVVSLQGGYPGVVGGLVGFGGEVTTAVGPPVQVWQHWSYPTFRRTVQPSVVTVRVAVVRGGCGTRHSFVGAAHRTMAHLSVRMVLRSFGSHSFSVSRLLGKTVGCTGRVIPPIRRRVHVWQHCSYPAFTLTVQPAEPTVRVVRVRGGSPGRHSLVGAAQRTAAHLSKVLVVRSLGSQSAATSRLLSG